VVRAPCAGLIVRRDRDPGDVVVPGSSMLFLVSTDELWISAWVDETEMARLGREVDRETREFLVDVRVRELPENWAVGQRAEVYVETGRKTDVVLLPTRFVVWRDGKAGTFIERDGHAAWRPLRLGLRGRESVEVVEGLSEGERAITPAAQAAGLKPGQRVAAAPADDRGPAGKQP
jgi:multidrug efflux pump subunit AcrA (membrane-fusion protein)